MICHCLRYIFVPFRFFAIRHWCSTSPWLADDIGLTTVRLIISKKLPYRRADFSSFIYNFLARCGTHFLLMKRDPADQHETTIWRNQTDTVTWLAVSVSLPTLLGYQRASAFVNATKLASQPLFSSDEEYKISNVLSNTFLLISLTCLSRYISFYRPALGQSILYFVCVREGWRTVCVMEILPISGDIAPNFLQVYNIAYI